MASWEIVKNNIKQSVETLMNVIDVDALSQTIQRDLGISELSIECLDVIHDSVLWKRMMHVN